jgi:hypothetical protein
MGIPPAVISTGAKPVFGVCYATNSIVVLAQCGFEPEMPENKRVVAGRIIARVKSALLSMGGLFGSPSWAVIELS